MIEGSSQASTAPVPDASSATQGRNRLAATIVIGHAIKHVYNGGMRSLIMPEIKIGLDLSLVQFGSLAHRPIGNERAVHAPGWLPGRPFQPQVRADAGTVAGADGRVSSVRRVRRELLGHARRDVVRRRRTRALPPTRPQQPLAAIPGQAPASPSPSTAWAPTSGRCWAPSSLPEDWPSWSGAMS